jgi:hypothetical protein
LFHYINIKVKVKMLGFIFSIAAGIGVGYFTRSIAWGIVTFFIVSIMWFVWTMMTVVGSGMNWLEENSVKSSITLPSGKQQVTFGDGGLAVIELNGDLTIIRHSPMLDASGAFL